MFNIDKVILSIIDRIDNNEVVRIKKQYSSMIKHSCEERHIYISIFDENEDYIWYQKDMKNQISKDGVFIIDKKEQAGEVLSYSVGYAKGGRIVDPDDPLCYCVKRVYDDNARNIYLIAIDRNRIVMDANIAEPRTGFIPVSKDMFDKYFIFLKDGIRSCYHEVRSNVQF